MPTKLKVTQISPTPANSAYVDSAVADLVDSAPTTLNTLKELSSALGDDPNFSTTITTALGNKLNTSITTTGSGNAITAISDSNGNVTATKGSTFSLSTHTHDYLPLSGGTLTGNFYGRPGVGNDSGKVLFVCKDPTLYKGDIPTESRWYTLAVACDASGSIQNNYKLGQIEAGLLDNNSTYMSMHAFKNEAGVNTNAGLEVGFNSSGNVYTKAPTPATSDNSTQIATTAFVKAQGYTTATGHTHSYLPLDGGTLTGGVNCTTTYTDATTTYTSTLIRFNSCNDQYGNNVMFGGSANTIVGGGEAAANQLNDLRGTNGENLYLVADSNIYFKPNGNSWANAKTVTLNNAAELSGLAKVTSTSFVGALTGNVTGNCSGSSGSCTGNAATATTATKLGTATVGGTAKPIYLNAGAATALSGNIGDANTPVYISGGTITSTGKSFANYLTKTTNVSEMGRYIDMHYDNATAAYDYDVRLYVSAQGTAAGGGTLTITAASVNASKIVGAYYADYAEWFPRGEETEPGDVIVLDLDSDEEKYIKSTKDNRVAVGVHSDNYHHIIGGDAVPSDKNMTDSEYNMPKYIPVALAGRIDTKFIGKGKKGSYVVASEIAGVARMYDRTKDDPTDIFGILVVSDDKDQEIRRLKVKLK